MGSDDDRTDEGAQVTIPIGIKRDFDIQRVRNHGTATVAELEQAAKWIPVRGYEMSGDAIMILERKGFFK